MTLPQPRQPAPQIERFVVTGNTERELIGNVDRADASHDGKAHMLAAPFPDWLEELRASLTEVHPPAGGFDQCTILSHWPTGGDPAPSAENGPAVILSLGATAELAPAERDTAALQHGAPETQLRRCSLLILPKVPHQPTCRIVAAPDTVEHSADGTGRRVSITFHDAEDA